MGTIVDNSFRPGPWLKMKYTLRSIITANDVMEQSNKGHIKIPPFSRIKGMCCMFIHLKR
jgi:hypothetical protein